MDKWQGSINPKKKDNEKEYLENFVKIVDFPSVQIKKVFFNPKYPGLMYTLADSEMNLETDFQP